MNNLQSDSMIGAGSINMQRKPLILNYTKLIFDPNAFSHLVIASSLLFESIFCGMTQSFLKTTYLEISFSKILFFL